MDTGLWHCAHCGWSGSLTQGERTKSEPASGERLRPSERRYIRPPAPPNPDDGLTPKIVSWFAGRGIPEAIIRRNGITGGRVYMPQLEEHVEAVMFPYHRDGELVNIKYRGPNKTFRMVKDAERVLYGLDTVGEHDQVIVCEGEIDALSFQVAGTCPVLSVPDGAPAPDATAYESKFAFLASAEPLFRRLRAVILATDGDAPGRKLADELARRIGPEKCYRVAWPDGCKDANEVLIKHGADALRDLVADAEPEPIAGIVTVRELGSRIEALYERGMPGGVPTGWLSVDRHYTVRTGLMTIVTGAPGMGKALALDTLLPTPDGWTTMRDVATGDQLLDEQGKPCRVVAATPVMWNRPCYRVTFSDWTTVVCDAEHQWLTRSNQARNSANHTRANDRLHDRAVLLRGTDQSHKRTYPSVVTTAEIAASVRVGPEGRANHAVPVAKALDLPARELPIDPYVLGIWLGDGSSHVGAITTADDPVLEHIASAGYTLTKWSGKYAWGVRGLKQTLRTIGVLGRKHIPSIYARASVLQRRALLHGLMDSDGSITRQGMCEFTSMSEVLAWNVYELVTSLGMKPNMHQGRAMLRGRDCGTKYRVRFVPVGEVFRLTRKQERVPVTVRDTVNWRYILSCEPEPSGPVRCVQVDSPSSLYLATRAFIPTHNSQWIDNLIVNLARTQGWSIGVCSPENQPLERHAASMMAIYVGKPFRAGPSERMTHEEMVAARDWLDRHVSFVLPDEPTVDAVLSRMRALVYRQGVKGVLIDPWNELEHTRPNGMTATEYISQTLTRLRRFARIHDLHLWIAAHPTKLVKGPDGQYPVATPYDISDSASWFSKADCCLSIWRDKLNPILPSQVHIQKVRFSETGEIGRVDLRFDKATGRYWDTAAEAR